MLVTTCSLFATVGSFTFSTAQSAREYRYDNNTGGWILERDSGTAILFAPEVSPSHILQLCKPYGITGRLIGPA
jgi:hypothetical protein